MIYTREMQRAINQIRLPVDGFKVDICEYEVYPAFITLQIYYSQWMHLTDNERIRCLEYLKRVKWIIEYLGVPCSIDPIMDTQ